jgi:hypothetical protein
VKTVEIAVEVPADAYRLAQNPVLYFTIAGLTGVSVTFSPLFLYEFGREGVGWSDWRLWACFGVTFLVPMFYARLGAAVAAHAWRNRHRAEGVSARSETNGPNA